MGWKFTQCRDFGQKLHHTNIWTNAQLHEYNRNKSSTACHYVKKRDNIKDNY